MTALRQRMLEDLRIRNYAPTTVECYIRSVAEFARHFNKPPDQLGPEEIRSWQLFLLNERRVKLSTYIQAVCALRFFYRITLNRKIEIDRATINETRQSTRVKKLGLAISWIKIDLDRRAVRLTFCSGRRGPTPSSNSNAPTKRRSSRREWHFPSLKRSLN